MANKLTNKHQSEMDGDNTAKPPMTVQHALQSALQDGPNPLCIDLYDRSEEGQLRSSNGVYTRHFSARANRSYGVAR